MVNIHAISHISDVTKIISKLIFSKKKLKHEIFNICSNNPKKLTDIIEKINFLTQKNQNYLKENCNKLMLLKPMDLTKIKNLSEIKNLPL